MNKKDIAHIKKQFKPNNDLMTISDIFNVYIMKDTSEIYHYEAMPFDLLEDEQKELFLANFKKVLTGQADEKLFELKFRRDKADSTQMILHQGLLSAETEAWTEEMLKIVAKMLHEKTYEMDLVITFIRGTYMKPVKQSTDITSEESDRDSVYAHGFILCSINKTEDPKKELLFDYVEKAFKYNILVDPVINLKAPISGFLFPCFNDGAADVNHVLYAAGKAHEPNYPFIEDVLNAEEVTTAQEDKIIFEEIVKSAVGKPMNTATLSNVYEEINRVVEENEDDEPPRLDSKDVEEVLRISGVEDVDTEKVEAAFEEIVDDRQYAFKATSVMPKYQSKSIKIKTKAADLSVSPEDLRFLRQVEIDGRIYLMLEVPEAARIEGFDMIPEALFTKVASEED